MRSPTKRLSKIWLAVITGLVLTLQGCVSNIGERSFIQDRGSEIVGEEMEKELFQAADRGEIDKIRSILKDGVNINVQDANGRTSIMIATYNNDVKTAKFLIDAGADVNIQDDMKNNPFLYAGAEGYLEILKLTIDSGADPSITNRYGGTALIPASEHGYVDVIEELLTRTNIDVNHINNLGWTALLEAIILNNGNETQQKTIQLLIDHGADVNIPDNNQVTPLQHAREKEFKELEQILLKAGAL